MAAAGSGCWRPSICPAANWMGWSWNPAPWPWPGRTRPAAVFPTGASSGWEICGKGRSPGMIFAFATRLTTGEGQLAKTRPASGPGTNATPHWKRCARPPPGGCGPKEASFFAGPPASWTRRGRRWAKRGWRPAACALCTQARRARLPGPGGGPPGRRGAAGAGALVFAG